MPNTPETTQGDEGFNDVLQLINARGDVDEIKAIVQPKQSDKGGITDERERE